MALWNSLRTTLIDPWLNLRMWLLQFLGNTLLIAAFAWFLHIGDGYTSQIIFSAILVLLLVGATLVIHGGAMNYALDTANASAAAGPGTQSDAQPAGLAPAMRRAASHLLPLLLWAFLFYLLERLTNRMEDYQYSFPGWLRSEFPAWLRKLISEPAIDRGYTLGVSFLRWTFIPALLLPLGLLCADRGFRGLISVRLWWRMARRLRWWIVLLLTALLTVYLVAALMDWKLNPLTASLGAEKVWIGMRLLVAYIMAIGAWMIICAALARNRRHADEDGSGTVAETPVPAPAPVASAKA
ncbi:MAG TPA: hypothetical protein VNW97_19510 [Candidatus Saccharimonadales bacterium]|jgi:hypothetical protein|nr:hypothetical protein [Candidatus Saccharimonadales bacterium]